MVALRTQPMYHAIVLEDLLDLLQLPRVYAGLFTDEDIAAWRETCCACTAGCG